jgi:hypothetical protein
MTDDKFTFDDFKRLIDENKDAKELMLIKMGEKLFDRKDGNMLFISRLLMEERYYIIKHLIIKDFYAKYYSNIEYTCKLVKKKEYPFYKKKFTIKFDYDKFADSFSAYIDDMLATTVSLHGKGREEIIQLLGGIKQEMALESMKLNGQIGGAQKTVVL